MRPSLSLEKILKSVKSYAGNSVNNFKLFMNPVVADLKNDSDKALNFLKEDLKSIRTGKVNPALIENITVQTYGGQAQLKLVELGTTAVEGPSTIGITPFDPSTISDIEKAL